MHLSSSHLVQSGEIARVTIETNLMTTSTSFSVVKDQIDVHAASGDILRLLEDVRHFSSGTELWVTSSESW